MPLLLFEKGGNLDRDRTPLREAERELTHVTGIRKESHPRDRIISFGRDRYQRAPDLYEDVSEPGVLGIAIYVWTT